MKEANLTRLLEKGRLAEAAALLNRQIKEAVIIDPRRDDSWGIDADRLGYAMLRRDGRGAFCAFWQDMLDFFCHELEPEWGHLHKGHIYLRLGSGLLGEDLERAAAALERGLAEDRIVAEQRRRTDPFLDVEETLRDSPAYVTLCSARLAALWPFPSEALRRQLLDGLAWIRFDVIWGPQEVDPRRVQRALRVIMREERPLLSSLKEELDRVFDQRLMLSTLALVEAFLRHFLLARLCAHADACREALENPTGTDLGELLTKAEQQEIYPVPAIATVFRLARMLAALLPFADRLQLPCELTPRVRHQIAVAVKILLDLALVEWAEAP